METALIIVVTVVLVLQLLIGGYVLMRRNTTQLQQTLASEQGMKQLQESLQQSMQQHIAITLEQLRSNQSNSNEQSTQIHQRVAEATRSLSELQAKLAAVEASSKHLLQMGKGIEELQNILQAPKLRGNRGEIWLEELLAQMLPAEHFVTQYKFKTGDIADVALKLRDGQLLAIDSKFSLENFAKALQAPDEQTRTQYEKAFSADIKKRIDEIAQKYILPSEGTLNFAFMYVPAENVYYQAFIEDQGGHNLIRYAFDRKVVPVSPNSLFAYLELVLLGLRGLAIEQRAASIQQGLAGIGIELTKFHESYSKVGNNLRIATQHFDSSDRRLDKISGKVRTLSGGTAPELIEEPDAAD
jgi:DNA recombination protein RmuC